MSQPPTRTVHAIGVAGERVDRFLADHYPELSRAYVRRLIEQGAATIKGQTVKAGHRLRGGEPITLEVPDPEPAPLVARDTPITLLYEDQDLVVVDKPAGLVVHPAAGHEDDTLVNALLNRFDQLPGIAGTRRPGIVHRLDKDTSGVLLVAKSDQGERSLTSQLRDGLVEKRYLALVDGHPNPPAGRIDAPIGRDPRFRQRMAIVDQGKEALTEYREIERVGPFSLLEIRLITGRTHQIRVHLLGIGHPVVGDPVYGRADTGLPNLGRQFLHARTIGFRRPRDGTWLEISSTLPSDLAAALERARSGGPRPAPSPGRAGALPD